MIEMKSSLEITNYTIETKDGPICGYVERKGEFVYYKFKSIPYAKPPIGPMRFMPPVCVRPWTETLDCTKDAPLPMCFSLGTKITGSEDCLYVEVSTPNIKPTKLLPVMFWIGSFSFSYNVDSFFDPTLLNDQEVVFVRCGFRLGPFGFLSNNDFTATGNYGLKDIVMALRWIQQNIEEFGGDRQNVTIFGNSSGAVIVHLLILSPMASGLFHKAILQSASALNNWSIDKNPTHTFLELAKSLGLSTSCKQEIIEKLKYLPAEDIMAGFKILERNILDHSNSDVIDPIFKPCIEVEFEGQTAFLTKSPPTIIKSRNFNKVPIIIGSNNIEASVLEYVKYNFYDDFEKYNKNVGLLVPKSLAGETTISKNIGQQLLKFYLGGENCLTKDTRTQYLQLISDYYFLYYVNKTVRLHRQFAPESPVYYYVMNYAGEWSVPSEWQFLNSLGHLAELPFIFPIKIPGHPDIKGSRDSIKTRRRVVKMWTNFAKYGNPTPDDNDPLLQIQWAPVETQDKLNYLSIGSELTKGRNPFYERMTFWEELHKEHTFLRALVYFNDIGVSW